MTQKNPMGIVGAGAWGTALAYSISKKLPVILYMRDSSRINREPKIPPGITLTTEADDILDQCPIIILALPFQAIPLWMAKHVSADVLSTHTWISASKGICCKTLRFFPEIFPPSVRIGVLSGPSFASELMTHQPTTLVFAAHDATLRTGIQHMLSHTTLRIYTQTDPLGVSMGGALKNVLAIASGIADGIGLQANTISALVTRGIWEIAHLAKAYGANSSTVLGLSGVGDILLSCYSPKSRNRNFGMLIGQGYSPEKALAALNSTIEGYSTSQAIWLRNQKSKLSAPICEEVFRVLYEHKSPKTSLYDLMHRRLTSEIFP